MICRMILPEWNRKKIDAKPVLERDFTLEEIEKLNGAPTYYNVYYLPNYNSKEVRDRPISGEDIDTFKYVFVDMDLKSKAYATKDEFVNKLMDAQIVPSFIVDSGNGIHAYWCVSGLDAMSYLKLQRRLCRFFNTDEAVCKIFQLMRVIETVNTKKQNDFRSCSCIFEKPKYESIPLNYFDSWLPALTFNDEQYCTDHYNRTFNTESDSLNLPVSLPGKFLSLIQFNDEAKQIWVADVEDRSKADYRLGHIMYANGFTKEEAIAVLVNCDKSLSRSPKHRMSYAMGIVDKIWEVEALPAKSYAFSSTVSEILSRPTDTLVGTRLRCWNYIDATEHGFRLGQVIGLVAGVGVGKTSMALNMFLGFVQNNPDYDHFFVPLEQPDIEIALRWQSMCKDKPQLFNKVHIMSNYGEDGSFHHLSLADIREYLVKFQRETGRKVGCVVIDHIGALKKKTKDGENQGLMDICHEMKAFAIQTNTLLIMQSQANREKAGIGDLELDKNAAYGTVFFESYCDYLVAIWQPLKRCYSEEGCPTVTAFKFCKIRHKRTNLDKIQEDVRYQLYYDPTTELMRPLTQDEEKSFSFFNSKSTNLRKSDRKTDITTYKSITWGEK